MGAPPRRWIPLVGSVVVAAACGGRTPLYLLEGALPADAGAPEDSAGAPRDGAGALDARPPPALDGGLEPGDAEADAAQESPDACASGCVGLEVAGGTFDRSYDGFGNTDDTNPATVSSFRLDRDEVTVGRFRGFVAAAAGGWLPAAGAGKHAHLNGGQGLAATGGGYETGWDAADWNGQIPATTDAWNAALAGGTWTPAVGDGENLPVTAVDWYAAYAFCIWDGGFLPSEAEWNYAAAGGSEQRAYPWSAPFPPGSTSFDCMEANYDPCLPGGANGGGSVDPVGSQSPAGDGRWGQSDLAGNTWEWTLDWYARRYVDPCVDCAELTEPPPGPNPTSRVIRGGSFANTPPAMLASYRGTDTPGTRAGTVGVRCARAP
ncbi:MAG TPA: SUMF1/EgtB/PvdO family nonheme iron enzyme [Polyangiaceae bacterium]|jgi:formylglycine-generating enzyme required for sulfatase activity